MRVVEGMIVKQRCNILEAEPAAIFKILAGSGGENGWHYANWFWELRTWADKLVGGVGMRRGGSVPEKLSPGTAVDFWRVEAVEPDRLLRLRSERKTPGTAWLQFETRPRASGETLLIQTTFFQPLGLLGILYWYGLYPIHAFVFSDMLKAITRRDSQTPGGK